jgi:hypothetical protein
MKKLLVGTVYAPSSLNPLWLKLQRRYLDLTVGRPNYDHIVWLNRVDGDLFETAGVTVVGRGAAEQRSVSGEHSVGLSGLLDHFREGRNRYECFLALDSDAFPFRRGWIESLRALMAGRQLGWTTQQAIPQRFVATAIRTENLDVFFHPSVVFVDGLALRADPSCVEFRIEVVQNLMGVAFPDTVLASKVPVLPLLRSNWWNPHPLLAGVYGDLFYHHGSGSREPNLRAATLGSWDQYTPPLNHGELQRQLLDAVSRNTDGLLRQLTGEGRLNSQQILKAVADSGDGDGIGEPG